jgi:MoxR-like ATPase
MIEAIIIALFADGHILLEGYPGLGKTITVKTLSRAIDAKFQRIQFTPDLIPGDITGYELCDPETRKSTVQKGPIFTNLLLADEINRAPAKVQSALLESMQEKQVTIGRETFKLEKLFTVLAYSKPDRDIRDISPAGSLRLTGLCLSSGLLILLIRKRGRLRRGRSVTKSLNSMWYCVLTR